MEEGLTDDPTVDDSIVKIEDEMIPTSVSEKAYVVQISFIRIILCGHIYHTKCIQEYLFRSNLYPLCRRALFLRKFQLQVAPRRVIQCNIIQVHVRTLRQRDRIAFVIAGALGWAATKYALRHVAMLLVVDSRIFSAN